MPRMIISQDANFSITLSSISKLAVTFCTSSKASRVSISFISDRATAIRTAILQAQSGDGVLIAGKGHEDYQILGTEKIHFDDREQAQTALNERRLG